MNTSGSVSVAAERITFRPFKESDTEQILALFARVFLARRSSAVWRWRYQSNLHSPALISVAESRAEVIGHLALVTQEMTDGHFRHSLAYQASEAMVDRRFQHRQVVVGLRMQLRKQLKEVRDHLGESCPAMAYAIVRQVPRGPRKDYATRQSRHSIPVDEIVAYRLSLNDIIARRTANSATTIQETTAKTGFTEEDEELWERMGPDIGWTTRRTVGYLNWRYAENPEVTYKVIRTYQGDVLKCLLVLHESWHEEPATTGPVLAVVDAIFLNYGHLLPALEYVRQLGLKAHLTPYFWTPEKHPLASVLRHAGWERRPTGYDLVAFILRDNNILWNSSTLRSKAYHMIGDSEAYGD